VGVGADVLEREREAFDLNRTLKVRLLLFRSKEKDVTNLIEQSPHRRSAVRTSHLGTRDTSCRARTCRLGRIRLSRS
jgi:hypothetical protein